MNVLLHIEEIRKGLPIYHVGITYKYGPFQKRYDFHPRTRAIASNGYKKTINVGKLKKNPLHVLNYESELHERNYLLFVNDCRHYTQKLINYSTDTTLDVVNILELYKLFRCE